MRIYSKRDFGFAYGRRSGELTKGGYIRSYISSIFNISSVSQAEPAEEIRGQVDIQVDISTHLNLERFGN